MKDTLGNESTAVEPRRGAVRRHLGRCAAVLGIVTAMIAGSAGAATAGTATAALFTTEKCQENASYKICFSIDERTSGQFTVIVRLAVFMSQANAQKFVDAPPSSGQILFGLLGADFPLDENLGIPLAHDPLQAQQRGLFLQFVRFNVPGGELDEDFFGDDEIVGAGEIDFPSLGFDQTFRTPEISHSF
jgi:hypothetical protein